MIGRLLRPRFRVRGLMILVAAAAIVSATGVWVWRAYFSPTDLWLRTIRDPDAMGRRWEFASRAIRGQDPAVRPEMAVEALVGALTSPHWNVRADAAAALGLGGKRAQAAIPALIAALRDRQSIVRAGAARSMGAILVDGGQGRETILPALIAALNDRDDWVRWTAATELGVAVKPGDPEASDVVAALRSRLADTHPKVRVSACWSLTRLGRGRECLPVLIASLRESETEARILAVQTLADAGTEAAEAIPALEAQLRKEDNPIIVKEAERALDSLRGDAESQSL